MSTRRRLIRLLLPSVAVAASVVTTAEELEAPPGVSDFLSHVHSRAPRTEEGGDGDNDGVECADARPVTEKIGMQRMYPAPPPAPPGSLFDPYKSVPTGIQRLTVENFTFESTLAKLTPVSLQLNMPWIVDFYSHGQAKGLSKEDEAAVFSAAAVLDGVCSFAVCDLGEVVQKSRKSRALPAYPCLSGYSSATNFFGRMIASRWKGNRTLGGIVDSCLSLASESNSAVVAQRLDALAQKQRSHSPPATETISKSIAGDNALVESATKPSGKQPSGKQAKRKKKKNSGQIEAVCSACVAVADEVELALRALTSKSKSRIHEADILELLEPLCKTAVRGKYVLQDISRVEVGGSQSSALEWSLSGTTLDLGYSHADAQKKLQSERIWRYCDTLLEHVEEPLTESFLRVDKFEQLVHDPTGIRSLLCSDLTQECPKDHVHQRMQTPDAPDTATLTSSTSHGGTVTTVSESGHSTEEQQTSLKQKKTVKQKKSKSPVMDDFIITDEDVSTIQEVSPGVFVDNLQPDKIAAYLRGEPDELDLLVCKMEDLRRREQRDRQTLEQRGDAACDGSCTSSIKAVSKEIEKLKDIPVEVWSSGGAHAASQNGRVTYRSLEQTSSVPKCGASAVIERAGATPSELDSSSNRDT